MRSFLYYTITLLGGSPLGNTMRLWGYSIRVSNNSDVPPGSTDVCFTDNKTHILPTVMKNVRNQQDIYGFTKCILETTLLQYWKFVK